MSATTEGDKGRRLESDSHIIDVIRAELEAASPSRRKRILEAITLAALGSIPWLGGVLTAAATFKFDESGVLQDDLRTRWLEEHQSKLLRLREALDQIFSRLNSLGKEIEERIESPGYLALVRRSFRQWDQADTDEKRRLIVALLTNAAGLRVCSDDIVRLFLDWIERYHESHFAVIREVYRNPGPTRYEIWLALYGEPLPRDDSAEADLFRMLISDLTIGRVVRQPRDVDQDGRFRRKVPQRRRSAVPVNLESAFEDTKQYVLTGLGSQFVHYTMTELVTRLESVNPEEAT